MNLQSVRETGAREKKTLFYSSRNSTFSVRKTVGLSCFVLIMNTDSTKKRQDQML